MIHEADNSETIKMPTIETWQTDARTVSGRSNKATGQPTLAPGEQGIPKPVSTLKATSSRQTIGGATMANVQISHRILSSDQAFHHANVWITGLGGNNNPQLQSASTASPHTLLLPATGESVSLTVQSVGKDGSLLPLSQSPSTPVTL
jgi:hypothetical protein